MFIGRDVNGELEVKVCSSSIIATTTAIRNTLMKKLPPEKASNNLSIFLYNPRTLHWSGSFRICAWNGICRSFHPKHKGCVNFQRQGKREFVIVTWLGYHVYWDACAFFLILLVAEIYFWGIVQEVQS